MAVLFTAVEMCLRGRQKTWRRSFRRLALPASFFLGAACLFAQTSDESTKPETVHVRGTVINSVTREPIGRALVYSTDNRYAMLTDGEGRFDFAITKSAPADVEEGFSGTTLRRRISSLSHPGSYWFAARKPGFLDDPNYGPAVTSGNDELTISLMPEAIIKGRITLSKSEPAAGVNVQIFSRQVMDGMPHWAPGMTMPTNSAGEFRFAELAPGSYRVITHELSDFDPLVDRTHGRSYGYPPVCFPGVADFSAASTINLAAGQTAQADFALARQAYYSVRIPIENMDATIPGINVRVSVQGHRGPGYSLGYNAAEQTIVGELPNGNYVVEGFSYAPNAASGAVNIAISGAAIAGPPLVMVKTNPIAINVKEEFTSTEQRQSMTIVSAGGRSFQVQGPRNYLNVQLEVVDDFETGITGGLRPPNGANDLALALENVFPGKYWVRFNSSRGYVAAASSGSIDLLRDPLVVSAGTNPPIEITMRDDAAGIDGTVAGLSGSAVENDPASLASQIYVYAVPLPDSTGQFQQLWIGTDGQLSSSAMAPGAYRFLAFKGPRPSLPYRDAEAMRAYDTQGQVVRLTAGQKEHLQLQVINGGN